jgi:hypothetical protein
MVITQGSAQSLAALNRPAAADVRSVFRDEKKLSIAALSQTLNQLLSDWLLSLRKRGPEQRRGSRPCGSARADVFD